MKNIRIPLFTYGTTINHIFLAELQESLQKCTQIQLEDSLFIINLCTFHQLCQNVLINNNLILLIQYEELTEYDDKLQSIFDLIHFAQVKKVQCYIVLQDLIKQCQWKLDIIKQYIDISIQKFEYLYKPYLSSCNLQFIHSKQTFINQLKYFQTTPKEIDFTKNNDTLLQILSCNKNELEVALIQGILIKTEFCYVENQTAKNKPIQIIEIEGQINYINSNEDKQIIKIKIDNHTELKDHNFLSNNLIKVKYLSPFIIFRPLFSSIEKQQEFYMNYRNTQNLQAIIGGAQYDIKSLEFLKFGNCNTLKLTLSNQNFVITQKYQNSYKINSQLVIINKITDSIIGFGEVEEDNLKIEFIQRNLLQHNQRKQEELKEFYIPLNDDDVLINVERGELLQKGNHIIKCRICMENNSNTLLIPCGHLRYCFDCSSELKECLYCEIKIQSRKVLIIKQIDQNKNNLLKELMCKYQDIFKLSLQQNLNIEQNLMIYNLQDDINFNQYYCQKCNKIKGTEFVNCQNNHLLSYCLQCSEQIKECKFNSCNQKIVYKGKIQFKFQE